MKNKIKLYQVDAFTNKMFHGNPAAICPLDDWISDDLMQNIAQENNLAETGFYVRKESYYEIRWFTPTVEVDLCGHATLAAAHVIINHEGNNSEIIKFFSPRSGSLNVKLHDGIYSMDFPKDRLKKIEIPETLRKAFQEKPIEAYRGNLDFILVFSTQEEVERVSPDLSLISLTGGRGTIITSPGIETDFVSRFFAPQSGINEDPVCGSAHTSLTPYWADILNKKELTACQLSKRGGELMCELKGERVLIKGKAVTYLEGEIYV